VVRRRRLWNLFDGWPFASLFIALIDYFVALLKCIVEITDHAAATLADSASMGGGHWLDVHVAVTLVQFSSKMNHDQ
jgi:hypothetical protein